MAYPYNLDYEAASMEKSHKEPVLKTDRQMWKLMLFTYLTCGIYSILFFIPFSFDIDKVAPKRDGSKTFNFLFAYIIGMFTGSIAILVWFYHITERVEEALLERGLDDSVISMSDFWLWYVLGSLILVGPFVYFHKLCKAMNLLCEDFNEKSQKK